MKPSKATLSSCGTTIGGAYHLKSLIAKALFTEQELLEAGAVWDGAQLGWGTLANRSTT